MTKVSDDAWIAKAKKRKAYRDHMRDKFYKEVGGKKGEIQQTHTGAPRVQRLQVVRLLNATRKGDLNGDHGAMIIEMAKALGSTGLGLGEKGVHAKTDQSLDAFSMKALRDTWFWSPAFFD